MDPEHVIQLAVRAAEAAEASEPGSGVDAMSNEALEAAAVELGVELLRAVDVGFDAEGELQATVSSNSDAIAAARFIGFTAGTVGRRFGYGVAVRRAAALGLTDQCQGGCRQHRSDD